MDAITQGLLGAAIGEAGFRKKLGGRAVAFGAFCGVAPDFDMVAALAGEWELLLHHRGVSHSWVCEAAAAPLLGWLAWRLMGKRDDGWWRWTHLAFWALVTHPALDVCTAYGTQLFAPLTDTRYAIDAVSIIDPAYTLPLLVAALFAWRGEDRRRSRRVAVGALLLSTLYLGAGYLQSQRAVAWAEDDLRARGFASVETRAVPTLANIFAFRLIARDGDGRYRLAIASLASGRVEPWRALEDDRDPLVLVARATWEARVFEWFAMGFAPAELVHTDEGFVVRFSDLRYGGVADPLAPLWGADARFDREGRLLGVERWQRERDMDPGAELDALIALLTP